MCLIHHIGYFPEYTELICKECHDVVHDNWNEFKDSWIEYEYGDSGKFYLTHYAQDNWKRHNIQQNKFDKNMFVKCKNGDGILLKSCKDKFHGLCGNCRKKIPLNLKSKYHAH